MSKQVSEADIAILVAEAFGHKPPAWAVEARKRELVEAGEPSMTFDEAIGVVSAATFGRTPDRGQLEEANHALAAARSEASGVSTSGDLRQKMMTLMSEVASLATSRLGYSAERAKLYAQSEAVDARERSSTATAAVELLEAQRDHLIGRPVYKKPGSSRGVL